MPLMIQYQQANKQTNLPTNQLIKLNQKNTTILDNLLYVDKVKAELEMKLNSLKEHIFSHSDPENAFLRIDKIKDTMKIHTQIILHMPSNI